MPEVDHPPVIQEPLPGDVVPQIRPRPEQVAEVPGFPTVGNTHGRHLAVPGIDGISVHGNVKTMDLFGQPAARGEAVPRIPAVPEAPDEGGTITPGSSPPGNELGGTGDPGEVLLEEGPVGWGDNPGGGIEV